MARLMLCYMSGPNDGLKADLDSSRDGRPWPEEGPAQGWQFGLGRAEESDLYIPYDIQVSRHHASLRCVGGDVFLVDHQSSNGSFVGEQAITEATLLSPGILFRVGFTFLCLEEMQA